MQHLVPILLALPAIAFVACLVLLVLRVDGKIRWYWSTILCVDVALIAISIYSLWLTSRLLPPE